VSEKVYVETTSFIKQLYIFIMLLRNPKTIIIITLKKGTLQFLNNYPCWIYVYIYIAVLYMLFLYGTLKLKSLYPLTNIFILIFI